MKELTRTKNNVIRYFHVLSQCIKGWQGNNGELFINFLDSIFLLFAQVTLVSANFL